MRVLPPSIFRIATVGFGLAAFTHAQQPAPAPAAGNMIANGSFETDLSRENLWNGLNKDGFMEGVRASVPVLTQSGAISSTAMPVSVSIADMNGDGKPDLVASDGIGYMRVYFNQGTPQEPKFGQADLIPVFLTRSYYAGLGREDTSFQFQAQRISAGDFSKSGKNDILIGNYIGEILWLKNEGSPSTPDFRQPKNRESLLISTTPGSQRRWGNVFAPAAWDWNKDGKFDLLIGEGSYSANNIHLLLNEGSNITPKFDVTNRNFLAFGDGREQLTPTVIDFNNDGKMDLLVTDRAGKVSLYLNTYDNWKPGDEIKFASYVPIQGQAGRDLALGGITTVAAGDLNGDGLFDLVFGKSNGRIAVAYNRGTLTEPKFEAPVELKGEPASKPFKLPSGWDADFGIRRGNFNAYITTVSTAEDENLAPPAGSKAVKFAYLPHQNQIIKTPLTYAGAIAEGWAMDRLGNFAHENHTFVMLNVNAPANVFALRQSGRLKLTPGKTYVVSLKIKGKNVTSARAIVDYYSVLSLGEQRVEQGDRSAVRILDRNEVREGKSENIDLKPGASWTTVTKEIKIGFNDKRLNDKDAGRTALTIVAMLTPGTGEMYIDDVQVVEKK